MGSIGNLRCRSLLVRPANPAIENLCVSRRECDPMGALHSRLDDGAHTSQYLILRRP